MNSPKLQDPKCACSSSEAVHGDVGGQGRAQQIVHCFEVQMVASEHRVNTHIFILLPVTVMERESWVTPPRNPIRQSQNSFVCLQGCCD
jgi:hypothetical protein